MIHSSLYRKVGSNGSMVCVNVSTNQSLTSGNKAFSDISTQVNNWLAIILFANTVCIALW